MAARQRIWSEVAIGPCLTAACGLFFSLGCGAGGDDVGVAKLSGAATNPPLARRAAVDAPAEIAAGKQALAEDNYQEAVDRFTNVIVASEKSVAARPDTTGAQAYLDRGIAFLEMGFPDTAAQDFSAAIDLTPLDGAAYELRARAYVELGDAYKALRDATRAIRLRPQSAGAYQVRGVVYLGRGQFERAVADLQQAIVQDAEFADEVRPRLAEAYVGWSREFEEAGDQVAAAERLALARDLDPASVDVQIVNVLAEPTPVEQAVAKPVIDAADENYSLGRERQAAQQYDQALIEFTEAISLRSDFHQAYLRRGETLLALGFPDTALEDLKRAAHRGADSAEAYRLQAEAHMALESPHRAALSATDALHADPTDAKTYALRGDAYLQLENWDRAVADFNEAARRAPALRKSVEPKIAVARRGQAKAREAGLEASTEVAGADDPS